MRRNNVNPSRFRFYPHNLRVGAALAAVAVAALCVGTSAVAGQAAESQDVANADARHAPRLLYWFVDQDTINNQKYRSDIDAIAASGTFDLVFLTARNGVNFHKTEKMHPVLEDMVSYAHAHGLKVGLQLWTPQDNLPPTESQAMAVDNEVDLDSSGKAEIIARSSGTRVGRTPDRFSATAQPHLLYKPLTSRLLKVYIFKRAGDGYYVPGTLTDVTDTAGVEVKDAMTLNVAVNGGQVHAGWHAVVITAHYHDFPDLFGPFVSNGFKHTLDAYRDIPFDGAALDEFRFISLSPSDAGQFHERLFSDAMQRSLSTKGIDLPRLLLDMRYAPADDPSVRISAINLYFDALRSQNLQNEKDFSAEVDRTMGPATFHGIHDTFHNRTDSDEVWQTGLNWWAIPRHYGQSDEDMSLPVELGIAQGAANAISYNQYYSKDKTQFLGHVLANARWNIRTHYHAWNDVQGWGTDIRDPEFLNNVKKVEAGVSLIDWFNPGRPQADILMIFGMPALTNKLAGHANTWDINGDLHVEDKAQALWDAGYRLLVAPSYEIDAGKIAADGAGGMIYNGRRFSKVIYVGPQYSKQTTLEALTKFAVSGGKLAVDGMADRDFLGKDVSSAFKKIMTTASAFGSDVGAARSLGAEHHATNEYAEYEDGSIVLSDLLSSLGGDARPFDLTLQGHRFTGTYRGVLALHVDKSGALTRLAAGGLGFIARDGVNILSYKLPRDVKWDAMSTNTSDTR